ncbi:MAG TPA: HIT domain-containing protein [Myxococcota bacterium]|nr:HIT domain-containing protein [Myxococcota bacterium]
MSAAEDARRPLWAPWRIEYVEHGHEARRCIFCEPEEPVPDRQRLILYRGKSAFVLMNRYPYSPGHLMVAPFAHSGRIHALEPDTQAELMTLVAQATRILEATYNCDGLNVGANLGAAAGAGFADHLHFHLVPRWRGDVNFMTAVGEIRVIPTHIERSFDELLPAFAELAR